MGGGVGAVEHRGPPVVAAEERPMPGAVAVVIRGQVVTVVRQAGQQRRPRHDLIGHRAARGLQLGAGPLALGRLGPVLADPLRRVLHRIPVGDGPQQVLHGVRIRLKFGEERQLVQGELTVQAGDLLTGPGGNTAGGQRRLDLVWFAARGLADPGPGGARLVRGEQRGRLLQRGEVLPVRHAVGGHHVQELARLIGRTLTVQVVRHLGQPSLDRRHQPAMPLDHAEAAVAVGGDQQRHPDAVVGDRRAELRRQIQVDADVTGMRDEPVHGDHPPGTRRVGRIIHTRRTRQRNGSLGRGGGIGHGSSSVVCREAGRRLAAGVCWLLPGGMAGQRRA